MTRILGLLALCLVCAPAAAGAQESPFGDWMTYYYFHRDVAQVDDFLRWLQSSRELETSEHALPPTAAFLATVFAENPSQVRTWVTADRFTDAAARAVVRALWQSGHAELIAGVTDELPDEAKSPPVPLLSLAIARPGDLDMMWAAFMASGDVAYVRKLVDVLEEGANLSGDPAVDGAMRKAAAWSLGSNMAQHELVNRLIHDEASARTGQARRLLAEMVANHDRDAGLFPHRDGDFSALLAVVRPESLDEFLKPANDRPTVRALSHAGIGDEVAIKIMFAGMQLSPELMADVTFDIVVLDPDGRIYAETRAENVPALQARTPVRFRVFDNSSVLQLRFEPQDKLGLYRIEAEVRDNIGQRKIALGEQLELRN